MVDDRAESFPRGKNVIQRMPSWLVSLLAHVVFLVMLSFCILPTLQQEDDLGLVASTTQVEEVDDFQEVEVDSSEELESLDDEFASDLTDPGEAAFGDLSAESALSDITGHTALASAPACS